MNYSTNRDNVISSIVTRLNIAVNDSYNMVRLVREFSDMPVKAKRSILVVQDKRYIVTVARVSLHTYKITLKTMLERSK